MNDSRPIDDIEPMSSGFQSFENAAADIVLAASFNASGTRIVLCSADHRIRVYNIDRDNAWTLADQWRGHDAEILDVQWLASSLGQCFATIGGDNKFKIWQEDPSQSANQGRRFKCIFSQSPPHHVSYVAFAINTISNDTYLCLMTHDGLLSLLEPVDPEKLRSWSQIDSFYPFGQCPRGSEARFSLSFQQAEIFHTGTGIPGEHVRFTLAVSAINSIKIFHARKGDHVEGSYQLYEILTEHTDATQINEIAWAPGCLRPCSVIAAACDDGTVRIFEIDINEELDRVPNVPEANSQLPNGSTNVYPPETRHIPSGIGAGLAGMSRNSAARRDSAQSLKHASRQVGVLIHEGGAPVWKIRWIYDGSALASTGDDGKVHLWKESISGEYIEFAETEPA